jgi:hypothetical protein
MNILDQFCTARLQAREAIIESVSDLSFARDSSQ